MGKRELVALLYLSSWCLVIVTWLFSVMQRVCLHFVIMVFPDHSHFLFFDVVHNGRKGVELFHAIGTFLIKDV